MPSLPDQSPFSESSVIGDYRAFIAAKSQLDGDHGFTVDPDSLHDSLFPFQRHLATWALRKGRSAILADCGLGKTLMELAWAERVSSRSGKPVLLLTPLAVGRQIIREAERFGFDAARSVAGERSAPIVVSNYERLHWFDPGDFSGMVCDESSILKSFEGATRSAVTEFMRLLPFRLLATATAAPNDYTELGTSSEALGYLGHVDMIGRFFTNAEGTVRGHGGRWRPRGGEEWRFKGHAEREFWRWVASWARALRKPSDLGFADDGFDLTPLVERDHLVTARSARPGMLFDVAARGFAEEREVTRRTISERCEQAAALVNGTGEPAVVWCHLNREGNELARLIPDGIQISGSDDDDAKEFAFEAFATGQARVLITKPKIGAWGLNWQHCAHMTYFPSHSYESYYQAVRRCWRFGQRRSVVVDIVATEGELEIQANLRRKSEQAVRMFDELVSHMHHELAVRRQAVATRSVEVPTWLIS